jgi:hypothetical protein
MAVPPIDFSSFPPQGSSRPGGPGLEAAANRYIERMRREQNQDPQKEEVGKVAEINHDTVSLAPIATQNTKANPIISQGSETPLVP